MIPTRAFVAPPRRLAMVEVRSFARHDREQLTRLVNAHIATATPGGSIPSATLLSQLEHPLGEHIIGPWVTDLATFVAVQRDRIVGAAHLRRYADDQRASDGYRNTGELVWLLCWPEHLDAGRAVRDAALAHLSRWGVRVYYGDGSLPAPGVYGVSDSWPHVRVLYEEAGFDPSGGQVEIVYAGTIDSLAVPGGPPVRGVTVQRRLGPLGTAFNAVLDGEVVGTYEIDDDLTRGGANLAFSGWADECNHWVRQDLRGKGIGSWLVGHAGAWLRLGGTSRLLAYAIENEHVDRCTRHYARCGLMPVNRTVRGWRRDAPPDRHQGDQAPRRS
jgi:GNAT superfamily N-acetyltransferase